MQICLLLLAIDWNALICYQQLAGGLQQGNAGLLRCLCPWLALFVEKGFPLQMTQRHLLHRSLCCVMHAVAILLYVCHGGTVIELLLTLPYCANDG